MALKPGMVVADIGTGAGYMLPYLSRAVGAQGRVLAEDIFRTIFWTRPRANAKSEKLANVDVRQGHRNRSRCCPKTAWMWRWRSTPIITMTIRRRCWRVAPRAARGGRLVIVEYYKRGRHAERQGPGAHSPGRAGRDQGD